MNPSTRDRAAMRVEELALKTDALVPFWRSVSEVLRSVVPHYSSPCWYAIDPSSLLITTHFQEDLSEFPAEWLTEEVYGDDVNRVADVARSVTGLSTLHEATGGDPSASVRWQQNMTMGADQELMLALRARSGEAWGVMGLYREPGAPTFSAAERGFLLRIAPALANGIRQALLFGEAADPEGPNAPGFIILGKGWEIETSTPNMADWLDRLPGGNWAAQRLPTAVLSLVAHMRHMDEQGFLRSCETANVRAVDGTWLSLHGTSLSSVQPRYAVIAERTDPDKIHWLLMAAYGLTQRERDVCELVLQGVSTLEIARVLNVSAHTVQQHLKNIFEKTGVRSRRDLIGKTFFRHYEPRLRDNERRVQEGRHVLGGPAPWTLSAGPSAAAEDPSPASQRGTVPSFAPPID